MPCDIKSTLKEEIENYLKVCGLLETLDVFREEFESKLKISCNDVPFKCSKSSVAKRYFENKAEVAKTRLKIYCARKILSASTKKLAKLHLKLNDIMEACSERVSVNLELVSALENKIRCNVEKSLVPSKDIPLDGEKLIVDLAKNIISILTDKYDCNKLTNLISMNSVVDKVTDNFDSHDRSSSSVDTASEFIIIPDEELKIIHPLSSVISLLSNKAFGNSNSNISNVCSKNDFQNSDAPTFSWHKNSKDFVNTLNDSNQFSDLSLNTCETYSENISSSCSCSCNCCQGNNFGKIRKDKGKNLRKWSENFFKTLSTNDICSSESINSGVSIVSSSLFSSNINLNKIIDSSDSEISRCESFDKYNKDSVISLLHNKWSSDSFCTNNDVDGRSCRNDYQHKDETHFWKESIGTNEKKFKINVAEQKAKLLRILCDGTTAERDQRKFDLSNSKNIGGKCFPDTYLSKNEKKMADNVDCNMILDSKTPFRRDEVKEYESSICSNNHGQVPNGNLGSTYTIQSGSRLKIFSGKGTDEVLRFKRSALHRSFSDKSEDKIRKRVGPSRDLNIFCSKSGIIEESNSSTNNLQKSSSVSSCNSCLNEQQTEIYKTHFDTYSHYGDSELSEISDYVEFEDALKPFHSSSVIEICVPECKTEKIRSNYSKDNFVRLLEPDCVSSADDVKNDRISLKKNCKKSSKNESLASVSIVENHHTSSSESISRDEFIRGRSNNFCFGNVDFFSGVDAGEDLKDIITTNMCSKPVQRIKRNASFYIERIKLPEMKNYRCVENQRKTSDSFNDCQRLSHNILNEKVSISSDETSSAESKMFQNFSKRNVRRLKLKSNANNF